MNRKLLVALVVLNAMTVLCAACGFSDRDRLSQQSDRSSLLREEMTRDPEWQVKIKSLHEGIPVSAQQLNPVRRLPLNAVGSQQPMLHPIALVATDSGEVYISDNNAHAVRYCPVDSDALVPLFQHEGKGDLEWPNAIQMWRDSILISDNIGIKVFNRDGSLQRLIRHYYQVNHFAMMPDGRLLVNPSFSNAGMNPLIVELSAEGTRLRAFGKRLNNSDHFGLDDEAYVTASGDTVAAVFRYRPAIQIYSASGSLTHQFEIHHPAFAGLQQLSNEEAFVHPGPSRYRLPRFVAGARLLQSLA